MTKTYDMHEMTKAVLWEEAKGKLRAMVACDGALTSERGVPGTDRPFRFEIVKEAIDDFIKHMEDNEFHL
jgi:hypothetical protein